MPARPPKGPKVKVDCTPRSTHQCDKDNSKLAGYAQVRGGSQVRCRVCKACKHWHDRYFEQEATRQLGLLNRCQPTSSLFLYYVREIVQVGLGMRHKCALPWLDGELFTANPIAIASDNTCAVAQVLECIYQHLQGLDYLTLEWTDKATAKAVAAAATATATATTAGGAGGGAGAGATGDDSSSKTASISPPSPPAKTRGRRFTFAMPLMQEFARQYGNNKEQIWLDAFLRASGCYEAAMDPAAIGAALESTEQTPLQQATLLADASKTTNALPLTNEQQMEWHKKFIKRQEWSSRKAKARANHANTKAFVRGARSKRRRSWSIDSADSTATMDASIGSLSPATKRREMEEECEDEDEDDADTVAFASTTASDMGPLPQAATVTPPDSAPSTSLAQVQPTSPAAFANAAGAAAPMMADEVEPDLAELDDLLFANDDDVWVSLDSLGDDMQDW